MMAIHDKKSEGRYLISLEPTEVEVDGDGDVLVVGYCFLSTARLAALGVKFEKLAMPDEDPPGTVRVRELAQGVPHYYIKNAAGNWNLLRSNPLGLSNTYNRSIGSGTDSKVVDL
jgi:hypothetical protein